MENKKVLLTNFEIAQFSGSEITITSIAHQFKKNGYMVYMLSLNYAEPLFSIVKDEFDVIIDLSEGEFDFSNIEFDLVWSQHTFLLDTLIFDKGLKAKKIVVSSLSPFEPFESVPVYSNELTLTIANSFETRDTLISEGTNVVELFENFSYEEYFNKPKSVTELKKIAIVSNHIPEEIFEVASIMREKEYVVEIYGLPGEKKLVTDEILKQYDLIITIGKTVQYAMSLKIPVYIYDRFGGPGYLKMENIENNRMHNFSGRGYTKNTSSHIVDDIINNFKSTLKDLNDIHEYAYRNFCFERNFDIILKKIEAKKNVNLDNITEKFYKYRRRLILPEKLVVYAASKEYNRAFNRLEATYKARIELAESDNRIILEELKKAEKENENLRKRVLLVSADNEKLRGPKILVLMKKIKDSIFKSK